MEFIFSAWLRPQYKEIYSKEVISVSGVPLNDCEHEFFDGYDDTGVFSLFDENTSGLWFICGRAKLVDTTSETAWGTEYDGEYHIGEILTKRKCANRSELREIMLIHDLYRRTEPSWESVMQINRREKNRYGSNLWVSV